MADALFKKSPENIFKRIINYSFAVAICSFVIGLVLLFLPKISNKVVGIIIGANFLFSGMGAIYNYFQREGAKIYTLNIYFGILCAILGVVLIVFPYSAMTFVTIGLGIFLIVNGGLKINYAVWLKIGDEDSWLITLASGILLIIFGIMNLFDPFSVSLTITQIAGAFLMINGVLDFMNTYMFKSRTKEIIDIFW